MPQQIKTIIADDHEFFRKGVKISLKGHERIVVIDEAKNGIELLEKLKTAKPDVILMDIKMPQMDGIEATKIIKKEYSNIKILALSMLDEEKYLERMIQVGINGYLLKNSSTKTLINAIEQAARGKQYFSEEFMTYFTKRFLPNNTNESPKDLSKRELEVLNCIAKGYTNHEIADKLSISLKTVKNHRTNIITKTGSRNTASLLVYAFKNNILDLNKN